MVMVVAIVLADVKDRNHGGRFLCLRWTGGIALWSCT